MGNRPSSYFGFGVALEQNSIDFDDDAEDSSPSFLMGDGGPDENGVTVKTSGYCDEPYPLVLIHASVSLSDDWTPAPLAAGKVVEQPGWADAISAYLDRWELRGCVRKGFEKPGFLHAPYYG